MLREICDQRRLNQQRSTQAKNLGAKIFKARFEDRQEGEEFMDVVALTKKVEDSAQGDLSGQADNIWKGYFQRGDEVDQQPK